jgi:hypothetical protein
MDSFETQGTGTHRPGKEFEGWDVLCEGKGKDLPVLN